MPKTTVTPEDFTYVGGFKAPEIAAYTSGITYRYINGQLYLYSCAFASDRVGRVYRFPVPEDSFLAQSGTYPTVTEYVDYGNIFQDKIVNLVDTPNTVGIAGGASPAQGLWWDESTQRMYWAKTVLYNAFTDTSDACIGYSTLGESSGTGVGSWKISPPLHQGGYGNRWAFSFTPIPSEIANTYLGGRRIGVGFGGGISIISNGTPSFGPALFAIKEPNLSDEEHLEYLSTPPIEMISHLNTINRAKRPPILESLSLSFDTAVDEWDSSCTCFYGTWVEGASKSGVIFFSEISGGNADTVVLDSPTPTSYSFAVADPGDIQSGDLIRIDTSVERSETYPWQLEYVASVVGNVITLEAPVDGIPTVDGRVACGNWYDAGGGATSRWNHAWYIYSPDDLISVATGQKTSAQTSPTYNLPVGLEGVSFPLRGTRPGMGKSHVIKGSCFDSSTNRLMLAVTTPDGGFDVRIYQLNDDIVIPGPGPSQNRTRAWAGRSRVFNGVTPIQLL